VLKRISKEKTKESTSLPEPDAMTKAQISQLMSAMGKKGGKIGGKRRLITMTPEERSERASIAARARWEKRVEKQ
jgi:hypothetical protein